MIIPDLEPRTLWYTREEGGEPSPLILTFRFDPDKVVTLPAGHQLVSPAGHVEIRSETVSWISPVFSSSDQISLIFWLMKISDSYLSHACESYGLEIYSIEPGDIVEPFDVFRW